jgi:hypothetical protein
MEGSARAARVLQVDTHPKTRWSSMHERHDPGAMRETPEPAEEPPESTSMLEGLDREYASMGTGEVGAGVGGGGASSSDVEWDTPESGLGNGSSGDREPERLAPDGNERVNEALADEP